MVTGTVLACAGALAALLAHTATIYRSGASGVSWDFLTAAASTAICAVALLWAVIASVGRRAPTPLRARRLTVALAGCVLLLGSLLSFSPLPLYLHDAGARYRVDRAIREAALQKWAQDMMALPQEQWGAKHTFGPYYELDARKLPAGIRAIPMRTNMPMAAVIVADDSGRALYLDVAVYRGRPQPWGVRILARRQPPRSEPNVWTRHWSGDVYGWMDIGGPE